MSLTDFTIKNSKPKAKAYKLGDGGGLYLQVNPSGTKLWRMKYRWEGREKKLAIGPYPLVSLADARTKRDQARLQLVDGKDPSRERCWPTIRPSPVAMILSGRSPRNSSTSGVAKACRNLPPQRASTTSPITAISSRPATTAGASRTAADPPQKPKETTFALLVPPVGLRPPYATSRAKLAPSINGSQCCQGVPFARR